VQLVLFPRLGPVANARVQAEGFEPDRESLACGLARPLVDAARGKDGRPLLLLRGFELRLLPGDIFFASLRALFLHALRVIDDPHPSAIFAKWPAG
jgi:hypothetical protein